MRSRVLLMVFLFPLVLFAAEESQENCSTNSRPRRLELPARSSGLKSLMMIIMTKVNLCSRI